MAALVQPQDYIDKIYTTTYLQREHINPGTRTHIKETLALSGPHDNHHDFKINRDDLLKELKDDFMCFPTVDDFPWNSTDDAFLEYLGITRAQPRDNSNAVYEFEVDAGLEPNSKQKKIQETINANYHFYVYDHNSQKDPIRKLIKALEGNTNDNALQGNTNDDAQQQDAMDVDDDTHTYDLVVDTQYYFLRNLIEAGLSKKFNFLENEATVFDPAKKMRPKPGTKGGKYLSFGDNDDKIKFRAEEGSQIIPKITGITPNCVYTDTNNHNILFSSKLPISVFTNGKNADGVIKEAYAIVENENDDVNPYLVPHTFTEINAETPGFALFNKIIKKTKACMQAMMSGNAAIAKYHLRNFEKPRERTPIHYLMKRLGDALQALTCYIEDPSMNITSEKKLKWFVTLDTPCFGISLLYKTPVVIFCNNVTGYAPDLNTDFKNITVAVRRDLLTQNSRNAARIAAEQRKEAARLEQEAQQAVAQEKLNIEIKNFKTYIKEKNENYLPQLTDGKIHFDDKIEEIIRLTKNSPDMKIYTMYKIIENKLLFSNIDLNIGELNRMLQSLSSDQYYKNKKYMEELEKQIEKEYKRRKESKKLIENLYEELQDVNLPNNIGNVAPFPLHTFLKRKKLKKELVKNGILVPVGRRVWKFSDNKEWKKKNMHLFEKTVWMDADNPLRQSTGGGKEYTGGDRDYISIIDYYKIITESLFLIQKSLFNHFYHYFNLNQGVLTQIWDFTVKINEAIPKIREDIKQKIEDKFNQNISTPPDEEMEAFLFYLSLYDEAEGEDDKLTNMGDIEIDETIVHNVCVAKRFHECTIYDSNNPFGPPVIRHKIDQWCSKSVPSKKEEEIRRGDRVEAKKVKEWKKYYPGEVKRVNDDGTYDIKFDDDELKRGVKTSEIKVSPKMSIINKGRHGRQEAALDIQKKARAANLKKRRNVRGVQTIQTTYQVNDHRQYFYDLVHDIQILHDDYEGMTLEEMEAMESAANQFNLGVEEDVGTMDQEDDADDNDKYLDKVGKILHEFGIVKVVDDRKRVMSTDSDDDDDDDDLGGKRKTKKRRRRVKKKRRTRKKKSKKKKIKKSKNTKKNKKKKPKKKIRRSMKRSKIMKNLVK